MDLECNDIERDITATCRDLLARHAGPQRAKDCIAAACIDRPLVEALDGIGFLDLAADSDAGPVAAALVTEDVCAAAGLVPIGVRTLVARALLPEESLPPVVAIADDGATGPIRFAEQADMLLLVGSDEVRVLRAGEWTAVSEPSRYGYPLARIVDASGGEPVGPGSATVARRWWQVSIAAEVAGTATAAIELTTRYIKEREQFGRPIGAYQVLQHRLVDCLVQTEATRWLAREAADLGAPAARAASAAIAAAQAARLVTRETHQMTGAMGFTHEYDLHVWSLRLQALRLEAGGIPAFSDDLIAARYRVGAEPTTVNAASV